MKQTIPPAADDKPIVWIKLTTGVKMHLVRAVGWFRHRSNREWQKHIELACGTGDRTTFGCVDEWHSESTLDEIPVMACERCKRRAAEYARENLLERVLLPITRREPPFDSKQMRA